MPKFYHTIRLLFLPVVLALLFTVIFSLHSLNRHFSYNSHALDLGIHTQAIYLFSQNLLPFSSILHMPYLADHFGLIMFFLSPIYRLFPSTETVLLLQATLVGLSGIFIYFIALDKTKSVLLSFIFGLSYLASPSILSAVNFDFHLATISVFPLSLILFAWHFQKWNLYFFSLILGILFKEDLQIFIFGLGIYQILKKQYLKGFTTSAFAIISFYIIKFKIIPFLWRGAEDLDVSTSLLPITDPIVMFYVLFLRPTILIDLIFNSPVKLDTIDFVFRQFMFLSLLSPLSWLTVIPALLLRFSSLATHFWSSSFHYNANLTPFLAVSAILAITTFKLPKFPIALLLVFFLITGGLNPNSIIWTTIFRPNPVTFKYQYINNALTLIPPNASISAQSPIVPHLSNREKIYMFPEIYDSEYIVLDTSLSSYPLRTEELKERIIGLKKSKSWQTDKVINTLIILRRKK